MHYPGMPPNFALVHKSGFAVFEGIEVRFADSSLTGGCCSKILLGGGRFCGRSGGGKAG